MSPKRGNFQRRARQSALVHRLNHKNRSDPFDSRWMRVDGGRLQVLDWALIRRLALAAGVVLAIVIGMTSGPSLLTGLLGGDDAVRIEGVAVQGHRQLSAEAVALASGVERGNPVRDLAPREIEAALVRHPLIREARAVLLPNGQLVLQIDEREPRALLHGPAEANAEPIWRIVDDSGTPFAQTRADAWSRLPRLRSAAVIESDRPSAGLLDAIALVEEMKDERFAVLGPAELEVPDETDAEGWVLHTRSNPRRVVLGGEAWQPRLERLAMLLDAKLPEARTASEIDLRFAGQAVLRSRPASR